MGSNPIEETNVVVIKSKKKEDEKFQPHWHCCMCCNPTNGRLDFEDDGLIKSSFIDALGSMKVCQLTRTKVQQKQSILLFDNTVQILVLASVLMLLLPTWWYIKIKCKFKI